MTSVGSDFSRHLGSVPSSRPSSGHWTFNIGEPITDEEYSSHQKSTTFLADTFPNSPFADIQQRYNDFKDLIQEVEKAFEERRVTPQTPRMLAASLDDFLTALRRFADRTGHMLSQRYGKESPQYTTFRQALSYEFDSWFPYRFAWHLRNYSDHRGSVPFRLNHEAKLGSRGEVVHAVQVLVDSNVLLESYDWHSRVRVDLEQINGEFSIEAVVNGVQLSCLRVYCKSILVQQEQIASAMANIREYAQRADPPDGFVPVFVNAPLDISSNPNKLTASPISIELVDVAESALQQARVVAA